MSGSSHDYFYSNLDLFLDEYPDLTSEGCTVSPHILGKRRKLHALLRLCAEALHDIEWVDSGDYGDGDEEKAIDAVFAYE